MAADVCCPTCNAPPNEPCSSMWFPGETLPHTRRAEAASAAMPAPEMMPAAETMPAPAPDPTPAPRSAESQFGPALTFLRNLRPLHPPVVRAVRGRLGIQVPIFEEADRRGGVRHLGSSRQVYRPTKLVALIVTTPGFVVESATAGVYRFLDDIDGDAFLPARWCEEEAKKAKETSPSDPSEPRAEWEEERWEDQPSGLLAKIPERFRISASTMNPGQRVSMGVIRKARFISEPSTVFRAVFLTEELY